jgi:hypothetical protein
MHASMPTGQMLTWDAEKSEVVNERMLANNVELMHPMDTKISYTMHPL